MLSYCVLVSAAVQVGMGMGEWSEDKVKTDYNLVNPPLRDTTTGEPNWWHAGAMYNSLCNSLCICVVTVDCRFFTSLG
jgi:hypothetical protein